MTAPGWYEHATPIPVKGYWTGNKGRKAAVLHRVVGSAASCIAEFKKGQKSAHACIDTDGTVYQFVSIFDSAWANGLSYNGDGSWTSPEGSRVHPSWPGIQPPINPNWVTISTEHAGKPNDPWTPRMVDASIAWHRWVAQQTGLVYVPHQTLIGHYEISPVDRAHCPGPTAPFETIARGANGHARYLCLWPATVRQGPGRTFPIVMTLTSGTRFDGDKVVEGQDVAGDPRWVHRVDQLGFVHMSALVVV